MFVLSLKNKESSGPW